MSRIRAVLARETEELARSYWTAPLYGKVFFLICCIGLPTLVVALATSEITQAVVLNNLGISRQQYDDIRYNQTAQVKTREKYITQSPRGRTFVIVTSENQSLWTDDEDKWARIVQGEDVKITYNKKRSEILRIGS